MKIAISGPMGSGKTTIANLIINSNPQYKIFSFGQKLKTLLMNYLIWIKI